MEINELKRLWLEFEDIPININDEIESDFHYWKKGRYRFDIWHWFNEKLPNGLVTDFNIDA